MFKFSSSMEREPKRTGKEIIYVTLRANKLAHWNIAVIVPRNTRRSFQVN